MLEIFNEFCVTFLISVSVIFTNFVDNPQIKYRSGWMFIGVIILNIGVN